MATNPLELAKDRTGVFKNFLQAEKDMGANSEQLAFLDQGIDKSIYKKFISNYPNYLSSEPDGVKVISFGADAGTSTSSQKVIFSPYPKVGELPKIDPSGLNFLHDDIKQACICMGSFADGKIQAKWLGKNALNKAQFWSATKFISLLYLIDRVNGSFPDVAISDCVVRDGDGQVDDISFYDLAQDMVTYAEQIATSNSLAAMFKRFVSRANLEQWVKKMTGNNDLNFRGDYGESAFIENPELYDPIQNRVLLTAVSNTALGDNLLSAYDLTRLVSMLGWHYNVDKSSRLPGARWYSLECVVRAMGNDSARYVDAAIETLGLKNVISSPVIISKLGHGVSQIRQSVETSYVALVQCVDERSKVNGKPAKLRTLAMTLRGAKPVQDLDNYDREAIELDARITAEVTEILRRVFAEELP